MEGFMLRISRNGYSTGCLARSMARTEATWLPRPDCVRSCSHLEEK